MLTTPALAVDDGDFHPSADAQKVTYEDLVRWPEKYREQRVLLHGKVIQVKYADNDNSNAVALLGDTSGKNFVIVRWYRLKDRTRLIVGDTVDVWGIFVRLSFENAFKVNLTLPVIDAAQVKQECAQLQSCALSGAQH